ncbi:TetR/AcrR family transcriptional regulator [Sphingomonas solaris]|uniref:TetR/AcrR family transcriptional regulator n=1 Tax=Alterirhizorhabdus solaris TaxID=2529389 RepID=UPI001EEFCF6A|nr:TetR/AcrR family transcriptional regulator [Sphingomonas solaris]
MSEERMLDHVFSAFASLGYEGTTVREIAKQLSVSHNLLNVRFGSKADLWKRAIDWRVARFGGPVFTAFDELPDDPEARLRLLVHRFCAWAAANPDWVGITHAEGRRATWRLDYIVEIYIRPFKQRLDALFAEVAARRTMRSLSTSAFMALLVEGAGFYFASRPLLDLIGEPDERDGRKVDDQVDRLANFLLGGLLG